VQEENRPGYNGGGGRACTFAVQEKQVKSNGDLNGSGPSVDVKVSLAFVPETLTVTRSDHRNGGRTSMYRRDFGHMVCQLKTK
jgi:hypothetical protein